jgi:hypothetical protein
MYGPACLTAGALIITLGSPAILWMGIVFLKIGILGFELHLLREAQRVGFIKIDKKLIAF